MQTLHFNYPQPFPVRPIRKAVKFLDEVALAKGQFLNLRHHLVQTHLPLHYHLIQTIHLQRYRSQAPPLNTTSSRLQYSFFGNRNGIRNSSQLLVSSVPSPESLCTLIKAVFPKFHFKARTKQLFLRKISSLQYNYNEVKLSSSGSFH